ncbi:MAG: TonB-dependent receptor [Cytophagaceae bacterium]|nr:TonB-dependent receptor [Cytophagaceae bacterium]
MRKILCILAILICKIGLAQEVMILDRVSGNPISEATIVNEDGSKSAISNARGTVNLAPFEDTEIITVSHVSHEAKTTTKAQVLAQDKKIYLTTGELDAVVLSVSGFEQYDREVSNKVLRITQENVEFRNPQTAADLLQGSGEVYVQKSQLGGGSPMIRGFSTNRLLITVDGVRMNTAIFRSGNLQNVINVDPFALENTEVILGPGSVVYGSDAIGGVMNFYTKKPIFSFKDGLSFSGDALARYSTANDEKTGHVDFNVGLKQWAFLSSVSYSDYDDLRMGSHGPDDYLRPTYVERINGEDVQVENDDPNVQRPTGFDMLNLMQKVRFMPNETWDFNLGVIYSTTSNYSRYDRLTRTRNGNLRSAEWYYGPQDWFSTNFQVTKKGYENLYDEAKFTAAFQAFEESRHDRDFGSDIRYNTVEQVNAYSLGLDLKKDLGENHIFYGLEYVLNTVDSQGDQVNIVNGNTAPTASRYPYGATWQSMAAYASGNFRVGENTTLNTGLRYNQVILNAEFDDMFYDFPFKEADINTGNLTGSVGLNYKPSSFFTSRVNLSTAFRAPNVDDVGKIFDSEPGSVVVPNPDLKAEYAYNADVDLLFNFSEVFRLDLAAFYTKLDNALVRRDFSLNGETVIDYQGEPSNVQAIQNAANAEVYGFELGAEIMFCERLYLRSQLNWINGTEELDDGSEAPLRHAAPLFGNTHLVFEQGKFKVDAFAEYNGQFDYEDLAPSQQSNDYLYALDANGNPYAPSWYTVNLATQYKLSDSWNFTAALENITDQRYRPYSSGISAPGRNFIVGVKYGF